MANTKLRLSKQFYVVVFIVFLSLSFTVSCQSVKKLIVTAEIPLVTPTNSLMPTNTSAITSSLTSTPTSTALPLPTNASPPPTNTLVLGCIELLMQPWHLEATVNADEEWVDFSDQHILKGKEVLRIVYNLHGLMAHEGVRKNDSALVFT